MNPLGDQARELVTEEDHRNRDYWVLGKSLSPETQQTLTTAEILIVPWEKFRGGKDLFPEHTTELYKFIQRGQFASKFAISCDSGSYLEIHLHGDLWRLPTLFLSYVALPLAVNILSSFLYDKISNQTGSDHMEAAFIIEPPASARPCIFLSYKGPVNDFPQKILAAAGLCFLDAGPYEQQTRHAIIHGPQSHQRAGIKESRN